MELWRPVNLDGFDEYYEVSNKGRVRGVERVIERSNGKRHPIPSRIIKLKTDDNGYVKAYLSSNGKCKFTFVHRLVALAFIPNPEEKPQVNHINSKKNDNRVENLEWVTPEENMSHAYNFGNGLKGEYHRNSIRVGLYDEKNVLLTVFESIDKCADVVGASRGYLLQVLRSEAPLFNGVYVREAESEVTNIYPFNRKVENFRRIPVKIIDIVTGEYSIYGSRVEAEEINNLGISFIFSSLRNNHLYRGRYKVEYSTIYDFLTAGDAEVRKQIIKSETE